jgi:hypothetical protein
VLVLGSILVGDLSAQHDYLIDETYGDGGEKVINWALFDISRRGQMDANDRVLLVCSDNAQYLPHTTVIRLDTYGQLDQTFAVADGFPGAFSYQPDSSVFTDWPELCLTAGGKIVVANGVKILQPNQQLHEAVHVFRLNDDGSLDDSFGTNGVLIIEGYEDSSFIVEDANGDIFISCYNYVADNIFESAIIKVSPDGVVSAINFANQALQLVTSEYASFAFRYILVQGDNLLLFARADHPHPFIDGGIIDREIVVFKLNSSTGSLDLNFGSNGVFVYPTEYEWYISYSFADAVVLQSGEILMLLAETYEPSRLVKLDANGQLVNDFGVSGTVDLVFPSSPCNQFRRFAKHPSNGWYITSSNAFCGPSSLGSLSIAQLNEQGEPLFLENGYGSIEVGSYFEPGSFTTSVQTDGKLVVTGFFFNNGPPDLKATRINVQLESSVDELQALVRAASLDVYPNPALTTVRVKLSMPIDAAKSSAIELHLHDLQGRGVYHRNHPELGGSEAHLEVEHLPSGVYTLHCTLDGVWVASAKILVE